MDQNATKCLKKLYHKTVKYADSSGSCLPMNTEGSNRTDMLLGLDDMKCILNLGRETTQKVAWRWNAKI